MNAVHIPRTLMACLMAGAMGLATAVMAGPATERPGPSAATQLSDDKIKSFASAQTRVTEISQKWQAQLTGQETEAELQDVQDKARREMVIAVQNTGLSLQEYNQIAMAAQTDKHLQHRIRGEMRAGG